MFSVIIPLYNKARDISKSIDSVLSQSYKHLELIVVNDGSTDESAEIVKAYNDPRIKLIEQSNLGVSKARNKGISTASFELIAFLDADDWWHPDFLLRMHELIQEYPEAGIYGSGYYTVKNGKSKVSQIGIEPNYRGYIDYFKAYIHTWWMPLTSISVVGRKSIFLELKGFNPKLKYGEDFDLWIRIALNYKVAYINHALAYYNQDSEISERARGQKMILSPDSHYIFNLSYLKIQEDGNSSLKELLDGLRVRALLKYYLAGLFKNEIQNILNQVELKKQSGYYRRIYTWPIQIVRIYFFLKRIGSNSKQRFLMHIN